MNTKKHIRIVAWILGILVLLVFVAALAAQLPAVQTMLAKKAMKILDSRINGRVELSRIHISPFEGIVLQDVVILDDNAFDNGKDAPEDTLFRAGYLTATFAPKGLISKEGIHIRRVSVVDALFVLTSEPVDDPTKKGTSNIKRVFNLGPSEKEKKKKDKEIFHISDVQVSNMEFRLKGYKTSKKQPKPRVPETINWKDLDITGINLTGKDLRMKDGIIYGNAEKLSFREKSGFVAENISGKVSVGKCRTYIENLHIKDSYSDISMTEFEMILQNKKSFSHFLQEAMINADIVRSDIDSRTISYFAKALKKMDFAINANGRYSGYVCDFTLDDLYFHNLRDGMYCTIDGRLTGLPSSQGMMLNADISDMNFTLDELSSFIKGFAPSMNLNLHKFATGERFNLNGKAKGPINRLAVDGNVSSGIGNFHTTLDLRNTLDKNRPINISGDLSTSSLNLGKVLGTEELGNCTMVTRLGAVLAKGSPAVTIDTVVISKLYAHGYNYSGINGRGTYGKDGFEGTISSSDPNLTLYCEAAHNKAEEGNDGGYQFRAELERADLNALNLYKRGASTISLIADGFVNETSGGRLNGDIQLSDIILQDGNGLHKVGNVLVAGKIEEGNNSIVVNSSVLDGQFYADGKISDAINDLADISLRRELPELFGVSDKAWSGSTYDIDLSVHDSHDLLSFFVPGLYLADSTCVNLGVNRDGLLSGKIHSRRLALGNKYLKGVDIDINNRNHTLNAEISSDELSISPILTRNNRILAYAHDNSIGLGFTYDNETEATNKGEIYLNCDLSRNENDSLIVNASIIPSNIYLNSAAWAINPADIVLGNGRIKVNDLSLDCDEQRIDIDGGYSSTYSDSIAVSLNRFDISALNDLLGDKIQLGGLATGMASLKSPVKEGLGLLMDIAVNSATISGRPAGTINVRSTWNEEEKGFNFRVRNRLNGTMTMAADALFSPSSKTINGKIGLDSFNLGYAEPFLSSVFSEFDGNLSGNIQVSGPLKNIDISSSGLTLDDALMHIDFTNVPYKVSGPIHLDNTGAWFDNDTAVDRFGAQGTISGGINWDHFRDMNFATNIHVNEMEVLNIKEADGQSFYGNVFATGDVKISGPLKSLTLDVNASTQKEGSFHIPMSSAASASNSDLLTFKEEEIIYEYDPYEEMLGRINTKAKSKSDLGVLIKVNVDQGTEALIEIDKESGNVLTGRGTGLIDVEVRPARSIFNLKGNYNIDSGNYHLDVLGIAKKDFDIQQGSSVRFSGGILDSELDINAIYKTKAVIGTLIADSTSTVRRNVECGISISDRIRNPEVAFSINIPDLDPTTQAMVENALNTEDKVQKQFLSLLISGSFLPDEQSGIVNNSNMLNTTVSEIMANQLNNILQKLDIPVDLGLDFQNGSNGRNIYDVAISTELFNNKVIVNGTIGNRMYNTSTTNTDEVVGDLDIEIKMDKTGALRFNLFSHSADAYTSYLDNSQRNGAGLTYQREFNSLKEFIKDIFRSKEERNAAELERQQEMLNGEKKVLKIEE